MIDKGLDPTDRPSFARVQWKVRDTLTRLNKRGLHASEARAMASSGGSPITRLDAVPPFGNGAANIQPRDVMADDQALATCFELGFGNFFTGCRSTPGIMPATKQLDLLISEAARSRPPGTKEELQHGDLLAKKIDRIRWRAWHGRPLGALDLIDELLEELEMPNRQIQLTAVYIKKLTGVLREL